uniref:hypothetical protein n=1 Tax=Cellulomonas hominis TaxID=156981 RepID=UPI0018A97287|nr:hypothetical protein [Cellulomonas hominis]
MRPAGRDLGRTGERERTRSLRERLGFVFQASDLLPALTAQESCPAASSSGWRSPAP